MREKEGFTSVAKKGYQSPKSMGKREKGRRIRTKRHDARPKPSATLETHELGGKRENSSNKRGCCSVDRGSQLDFLGEKKKKGGKNRT